MKNLPIGSEQRQENFISGYPLLVLNISIGRQSNQKPLSFILKSMVSIGGKIIDGTLVWLIIVVVAIIINVFSGYVHIGAFCHCGLTQKPSPQPVESVIIFVNVRLNTVPSLGPLNKLRNAKLKK